MLQHRNIKQENLQFWLKISFTVCNRKVRNTIKKQHIGSKTHPVLSTTKARPGNAQYPHRLEIAQAFRLLDPGSTQLEICVGYNQKFSSSSPWSRTLCYKLMCDARAEHLFENLHWRQIKHHTRPRILALLCLQMCSSLGSG